MKQSGFTEELRLFIPPSLKSIVFAAPLLALLSACGGGSSPSSGDGGSGAPVVTYDLSGTVTYDWVPAKDNVTEGGVRIDYAAKTSRPARRIQVAAVQGTTEVASSVTNDSGQFTLKVPEGMTVKVRAKARTQVTGSVPDSIGPDACSGASWDVRVLNNVTGNPASNTNAALRPLYVADGSSTYSVAGTGANLNVPLTHNGSTYTNRAAAPFAMIDTVVSQIELVCQGNAAVNLPSMIVNWSSSNVPSGSARYNGQIGTSFYTKDTTGPNLYILGAQDVDTDEYDDHVIAHEFGHYIENNLYRSDSVGGPHSAGDSLDPRLAFGEGFGNAIAGMVFNDPVYVDTSGSVQVGGFTINVGTAPTGDDRGVYSETAAQHFLWKIYDNRNVTANSGSFDRIHSILSGFQRTGPSHTSLLSFSSYYRNSFGETADNLRTLWEITLDQPWNALCVGVCTGGVDLIDLFDTDNDIGNYYAAQGRKYRQSSGATRSADFWRLYRPLTAGTTHTATGHDQILMGGYSAALFTNKLGGIRWYRYNHLGGSGTKTVTVSALGASSCASDVLDMYVYLNGQLIAMDEGTGGCPSASFSVANGGNYLIEIQGLSMDIPSWTITVN